MPVAQAGLRDGAMTDLELMREVERLCAHPRAVAELLIELGARHMIRHSVDATLGRYVEMIPLMVALGVGSTPPAPLRIVPSE